MAELINRPQYLNQLIQNKDVDLVKSLRVFAAVENRPYLIYFISICYRTAYQILILSI